MGREEYRASLDRRGPDEVVDLLLDERVEPRGRLVEDEEGGLAHERLDQSDLLAVSLGQGPEGPVDVEVEPFGQGGDGRPRGPPRRWAKWVSSSRAVRRS